VTKRSPYRAIIASIRSISVASIPIPIILVDMPLPKPSGDFEWVQESWGTALRCAPLADVAPHVFSTRDLVLEDGDASPAAWVAVARAVGGTADSLVRMRQMHCAGIFVADRPAVIAAKAESPEADVAVSDDQGVVLTVRAADCVPVLLADSQSGAVAAVHAGWRGTAAGAVNAAVEGLEARYRTRPRDLVAAVGPSIGPCCYEVGSSLRDHFASHPRADAWFTGSPTLHLDLWSATRDQLEHAGVRSDHIHVCRLCTFEHPALFHSYRRDGTRAGRLVAAIRSLRGRKP
jgi:YfiH family protein